MQRAQLQARRKRITQQLADLRKTVAKDFAQVIERRQLTQSEVSYMTGEAPSQISLVVTGKLRGFSLERLLRMRALLDAMVKVTIFPAEQPAILTVTSK
jgi:predicted XRE-type DNA-binding protein